MCQRADSRKMVLVLVFCLVFIFIGCQGTKVVIESEPFPQEASPAYKKGGPPPWAPAHGYRAKHKYRYYPASRVYYEKERGAYFYYNNGKWQVSASLPSYIRIDVNDHVTLEMDTDKPYEYNHDVVKRYPPGQLKKKHKKKGKDKWK